MKGYKLFKVRGSWPYTIMHGHNGSKLLSMDKWLHVCPGCMVSNPGGNRKYQFEAGFHFVKTLAAAERYLTKFKHPDELIICPVEVSENIRPKPRSNDDVYLAQALRIDSDVWDCIILQRNRNTEQ